MFFTGNEVITLRGSNIVTMGTPVTVFRQSGGGTLLNRFYRDNCALSNGNSRVIGSGQICIGSTPERCIQSNVAQTP